MSNPTHIAFAGPQYQQLVTTMQQLPYSQAAPLLQFMQQNGILLDKFDDGFQVHIKSDSDGAGGE